jgi:hypothetical protein
MSSRRDFLVAWIVVDLAQQSLTQIKIALAGPNAWNRCFFGNSPLFEGATRNRILTWFADRNLRSSTTPALSVLGH